MRRAISMTSNDLFDLCLANTKTYNIEAASVRDHNDLKNVTGNKCSSLQRSTSFLSFQMNSFLGFIKPPVLQLLGMDYCYCSDWMLRAKPVRIELEEQEKLKTC